MRLEQTHYDNSETGCCAKFDPKLWDERELIWKDKTFLKEHVREFMHVPINFGSAMKRAQATIQKAEAFPEEPFWLTDEVSPWGSDLYLATDREIPGAQSEKISGTFLTKVFEGPYRKIGSWIQEMNQYLAKKNKPMDKLYFYYANCPKCVKHYGKNYVVLFAQVA